MPKDSGSRFEDIAFRASRVFTPSAPIDEQKFFAGRLRQLRSALDATQTKGQHVVVYGERGVGKTSLVSVLGPVLQSYGQTRPTFRQNCHQSDSYGSLWRRAFSGVTFEVSRPALGFGAERKKEIASLGQKLSEDPKPDEIVSMLRQLKDEPLIFIFDEFDQIKDVGTAQAFAETVKALSDYAVETTIVMVGVGDSVDSLIASHASVERALVQIQLPRMSRDELGEIIAKAMTALGTSCSPDAKDRIVRLAQGLPHYVHELGLYSVRRALTRGSMKIELEDVDAGLKDALGKISQSLVEAYVKLTSSPQRGNLFKIVLLGCALAETDELGYFSPAAVRDPLKEMGQTMEIPAFASHLNKFSSIDRGQGLHKKGNNRRFRYRFSNPLMQPYVLMRGVAEGLITFEVVDRVLERLSRGQVGPQLPLRGAGPT